MNKYLMLLLSLLIFMSCHSTLSAKHRSDIVIAQAGQRQGGRDRKPHQGTRPRDRQGNRPNDNRQGNRQVDQARRHQRQALQDLKKFERLRMLKLLDLLNLDQDTEAIVIPHIRKHHTQMFQIMKNQQKKINQLANGLGQRKFSDKEILKRIREIDMLDTKRQEKIRNFHIKAKEILTAEQLGKLYVFQARFGAEVLEKMRDFKRVQDEIRRQDNGN